MEAVRQSAAASAQLGTSAPTLADVKQGLACLGPRCTIYAGEHSEHVLQIYAGLYALHAAGCIVLRQHFGEPCNRFPATPHGLLVEVGGAGLVYFDVHD